MVVPKPHRLPLGLRPGHTPELRAGDGRLEIEIAARPARLKKKGNDKVAVDDLHEFAGEQVRGTLERARR